VAAAAEAAVRAVTLGAGVPAIELAVSVGLAGFGAAPLPSAAELLARADADMYATKRRAPAAAVALRRGR